MFTEHCANFAGQDVVDFEGAESWQGPGLAYRLRFDYGTEEEPFEQRLDELLIQPSAQLTALVIGAWPASYDGGDAAPIVQALAERASRLPNLKALFFGDIVMEEQELSWINQSDLTPLLTAFPRLEVLRVRGGNGLKFSKTSHAALKELVIETGGMSRSVLRDIFHCEFPNLEQLELFLGEENYGFDGGVEDLHPLLAGKLFPKLRYLGLKNSVIADEIAAVVVNAPIVQRLQTLDLSLGNMTEAGARALMHLPKDAPLQTLDITHHFVPPAAVKELRKALKCRLIADDAKEPEDEWRFIAHAE